MLTKCGGDALHCWVQDRFSRVTLFLLGVGLEHDLPTGGGGGSCAMTMCLLAHLWGAPSNHITLEAMIPICLCKVYAELS